MKKIVVATLLIALVSTLLVAAILPGTKTVDLAGNTWRFKAVTSEDPSTQHYLSVMYEEAEYRFAEDHTYTGLFSGISLSGTWDISGNSLILNKGTYKEEKYALTSAANHFTIQVAEKGKKAALEFVKE